MSAAERLTQRNREIEFLRHYDPTLDEPVEPPPPRPVKHQVRMTPRFSRQLTALDRWVRAGRTLFEVSR